MIDKTMNIYLSWMETLNNYQGEAARKALAHIKPLSSLTLEELNHIQWLISEELKSREINATSNT